MTLPEVVRIGPYLYEVERSETIEDEKGQTYWGRCHLDTHRIQVRYAPPEREWEVLIHEVLHAIEDAWDVPLKEKQVRRLGLGLTTFLIDTGLIRDTDLAVSPPAEETT